MNTILNKVLIFAAGAVIGSVVTYKLTEKKFKDNYERRLEEDNASIREAFNDANFAAMVDVIHNAPDASEEAVTNYTSKVRDLNYLVEDPEEDTSKKKVKKIEEQPVPTVIDPNEFGEYSDYDTQTLYYYTDDVLADDMDNVVEDVENIVGSYSLTTFGQFEDDAVHVRNDVKRCYYEILRSECAYSEKYGLNLYRKEDE